MPINTRYTGNNPVYAGPDVNYNPVEQERSNAARTQQSLDFLGKSAINVLTDSAKRK